MKLDCKHVWEHISEYIDKTVDAKLREDIERGAADNSDATAPTATRAARSAGNL